MPVTWPTHPSPGQDGDVFAAYLLDWMFAVQAALDSVLDNEAEYYWGPSEAGAFTKVWDASDDPETYRTGGTVYSFTLPTKVQPDSRLHLYRNGVKLRETQQYTTALDGSGFVVVTFVDGHRPLAGEDIGAVYHEIPA